MPGPSTLHQLVYVSRRAKTLSPRVLNQIVRHSESTNRARNITGVLICRGQHIMQLLEGDREALETLFHRIAADPRHSEVQKLLLKPVKKRLFPEWGMGLADLDAKAVLNRERLAQLVADAAARNNTSGLTLEARLLISDFQQQVGAAA